MEISIKFGTVKSGWSIAYIEGSQVIFCNEHCISFSEDRFRLMKQCRPYHLGLQCLQKYSFWDFRCTKGKCYVCIKISCDIGLANVYMCLQLETI